jgi:DNA polymerase III alpha subunit
VESKRLECGCEIPVLPDGKYDIDINNINLNCPKVWSLFATGRTRGVFQLETQLGRQYCKKLRPEKIEHLAALGAILRPGALKSYTPIEFIHYVKGEEVKREMRDVSMTDLYCMRKNGEVPVEVYHPALEPILKDTYQCLIYQEQIMKIASDIAGLDLASVDKLRKTVGKKLADEMVKCKKMFLDGCEKTKIVTKEEADEIFGWIEASARYSFNLSHSLSYSLISYSTAYLKAHFPIEFYTAYLEYAREKMKPLIERAELIEDAKLFDIEVAPPDIRKFNIEFKEFNKVIYYGLGSIKGVGPSQVEKLKTLGKDVFSRGWLDFLIHSSDYLSSTTVERLIETGALRCFNLQRQEMLFQYAKWGEIADKKREYLREKFGEYKTLTDAVKLLTVLKKDGGGAQSSKDITKYTALYNSLLNPPYKNVDNIDWIIWCEKEFLGCPLTCGSTDSYDLTRATCTCKEYLNGYNKYVVLGAEIVRLNEIEIKKGDNKGKKMAFVTLRDSTATMDNCVVFTEAWETSKDVMAVGKTMLFQGERSKKDSFQIQKVSEID